MSNRHRDADSDSITPSEIKNDDNNNHTEDWTESLHGETTVKPYTNPTKNTRENPLQSPESFNSEIFLG